MYTYLPHLNEVLANSLDLIQIAACKRVCDKT
jgi:hypothetical protein